jgi:hypothetical protein
MSEKQPQILIFNASGELVAIARSIRSAAELTKADYGGSFYLIKQKHI